MAMLSCFALLVSSIEIVSSLTLQEWAVTIGDASDVEISSDWEYRGTYGEINLFATKETTFNGSVPLQHASGAPGQLLDCSRDCEIWVVESSAQVGVQRALASSPVATRVLFKLPTSTVVAGAIHNVQLPLNATRISVATRKVLKPKQQRPHKLVSVTNPLIVEALRNVESESLHSTVEQLASYHTRLASSGEILEAEIWLTGELIRNGFEISTFPFRDNFSSNVIATLKGTKYPDQIVIAGAHYDSRGRSTTDRAERAPGADDNGSGSAAVLEFARVISRTQLRFEYTLQLIFFSGEEQGLVGSRAYAAHLAQDGADVVAMFNSDMLGYKLPGTVPTVGMKDRYIADWLLEAANAYTSLYVAGLVVGSSASCCSDHQSFTENGFPAIGFFENPGSAGDYPHYHQSTDLPQYIDKENHLLITKAMIASAMSFAIPDNE